MTTLSVPAHTSTTEATDTAESVPYPRRFGAVALAAAPIALLVARCSTPVPVTAGN